VAAESAEVEPVTPAEEVPDWLSSLRTSSAQPESRSADRAGETPAEETPDWMSSFRAATAESRLARQAGEPAQPESLREAETAPEEDIPDWLKAMRTETEPTEPASAEPDWLSSFRTPSAESAQPAESAAAPAEEIPDWLKSMQQSMDTDTAQAQPTTPAFAPGTAEFDFFDIPETPTPSVKSEMPPAEELPEWLSSLSTGELAPSEVEPAPSDTRPFTAPFTEQPTEVPPAAAPIPGAGPDWLAAMRPGDLDSALAGISTEAEPLTRRPTPSLISEPVEGLAPSALPSWLEAMRPVDVQRPQIAPETDTYEETVGVLAGMRGVLQAEPTIAMPRRSTMQVHQVNVSDAHSAQAALLTNLLNEDTQARPAVKRRVQLALPLERWMVFAILAVGLLIPSFLPGLFSLPSTISRETQAAYNLIEGLPPDKPALVAFDYDAAQTGELNPAAEALISHLLRRGVPIVGVSTRLTGAAVGQDLLQQLTADLNATYGISYTYGTHFINLGYIPGGPVGLLQFAAQPRSLFTSDFSGSLTVLETSLMSPVGGLNDFGLIVLITATPDSARAWVEQTQNYAANVPMVAAVSAGADPLVRPYYEADPPQIRGLVSGILQTTQYERQAGVSGAASARWERLGIGLLTAAALLAVGNLIYGVMGVLSRRAK
jgi:hypothetical protein